MAHTTPLVSVIMIFLNAERFIEEAIASIFAQTYPAWELLLVDDGSTDGSTAIARHYARQYPERVRYLEHPDHQNRGMSAARNLGIAHSQGEYIAFLDADDVYLPPKLAHQVAVLLKQPTAAMVFGASQHWYSWTGHPEDLGRDQLRKIGVPPDTLVPPPTLARLFLSGKAQTPGMCGLLVRRIVAEEIGAFEEPFKGMFEDQVFIYKICLNFPVFVGGGNWDRYRQHPHSHSRVMRRIGQHRPKGKRSPTYQSFLDWLEQYLLEEKITDRKIWAALNAELRPYRHPILYQLSTSTHNIKHIRNILKRITNRIQDKLT